MFGLGITAVLSHVATMVRFCVLPSPSLMLVRLMNCVPELAGIGAGSAIGSRVGGVFDGFVGASAMPRKAVLAAAVASTVGEPVKVPSYPDVSPTVTNALPPRV